MKQLSTLTLSALLSAMAVFTPQASQAQDDLDVVGWANVHVRLKAAPAEGGKVFAAPQDQNNKIWRTEMTFKQSVPVGSMMGAYFTMFFVYANPATSDGYIFAGWYKDNGDGVFDIATDTLLDDDETSIYQDIVDEDNIYSTQAAAKSGAFPDEPTDLIWAYYTRGAVAGMSWYQDDYWPHADCGTVWISKEVNEPGDEVTIRAIANDGYHFAYWQDADYMGNIVSHENPFTFTVKGGERYYAYFMGDEAPVFDLPEEGGFAVADIGAPWMLSDESIRNGARIVVMEADDMVRTDDGKVYLDMDAEDALINVTQWLGWPTLVYGKGRVECSIKSGVGYGRYEVDLVRWSGTKGVTLQGDVLYVYIFVPELGAFILHGTTDDLSPLYSATVRVPAGVAYFSMQAFDLTDDQGNIPTVIGLSPATYDAGVAQGTDALQRLLDQLATVEPLQQGTLQLRGQRVFTLSGVQVNTTPERGVYIVNGRKVAIK